MSPGWTLEIWRARRDLNPDLRIRSPALHALDLVTVGDALHNTRGALDYMTWQFALKYTRDSVKKPHRVQFPIVDSPPGFARQKLDNGNLWEIGPAIHGIFERFRPYRGGDVPLRLQRLRNLSNADKHRLLTPVVVPQFITKAGIVGDLMLSGTQLTDVVKTTTLDRVVIELGAETHRIQVKKPTFKRNQKIKYIRNPHITIEDRKPVAEVLDDLRDAVADVLRTFQPHL